MSTLVVSQPMFLPWRGLFEQIKLCDTFVFYDNVQLPLGGGKGRGFITRVQIKTPRGQEWLSLPVIRSGHDTQLICKACLDGTPWKQRHLTAIERAYKNAPYFQDVFNNVVQPIYALETEILSEFCIHSMDILCNKLNLTKPTYRASQIDVPRPDDASARVLEYCKYFGATEYITGHGAANYMDFQLFEDAGVSVKFMDYKLTPYPQLHGDFIPYVSVLDLLFNVGCADAPSYLNSVTIGWKEFVNERSS